jgi:hypothetical protein
MSSFVCAFFLHIPNRTADLPAVAVAAEAD